jgi:hypothetical protein
MTMEREGGGAGCPKLRGVRCGRGEEGMVPKQVQTGPRRHKSILEVKEGWSDDGTRGFGVFRR